MSPAYQTIRRAIAERKQIICTYQGFAREVCPHVIGHKDGREKVLTFQFAGQSRSRLPIGGQWRCMFVDEMSAISVREGAWHTGGRHTQPQTCVDSVDLEVGY